MGVTVIFPMAGRGERFGGGFKPFRVVGEERFINAAARPFQQWASEIDRVVCICLEEHDAEFDVRATIGTLVPGTEQVVITLPEPTASPVETVLAGVAAAAITGSVIACDCDHSVDVSGLFDAIGQPDHPSCAFPVWPLAGESPESWAVARLDDTGAVTAIAEKRIPEGAGQPVGVIGCYFFDDVATFRSLAGAASSVAEVISRMVAREMPVIGVDTDAAEFFGDPQRLQRTLSNREGRNA